MPAWDEDETLAPDLKTAVALLRENVLLQRQLVALLTPPGKGPTAASLYSPPLAPSASPQQQSPSTPAGVTPADLQDSARNHTRDLLRDEWVVAAAVGSGKTFTVRPSSGPAPLILAGGVRPYIGALVQFLSPSLSAGVQSAIANIQTSGATTTVTLTDALSAGLSAGDPLLVFRGFDDTPIAVPCLAAGTVAANGSLLGSASTAAAYTAPCTGSVVIAVTLAASATSSVLQVTRNNGTFWGALNTGAALAAQQEFNANVPVQAGDVVQFRLVTGTTTGMVECAFVAQQ